MYWGRNQRRIHHYETGLYLFAVGLALFLEDLKDRKEAIEFYEYTESRIQKEAEKRLRRMVDRQGWVPSFHR